MLVKILDQRLNCYLFAVYCGPSTDDRVFDCLCEVMGASSRSILSLSFVLSVISTVTIQSGWVPPSLMLMMWLVLN